MTRDDYLDHSLLRPVPWESSRLARPRQPGRFQRAAPGAEAVWLQFVLALLQGAGAGASNTVAAMYIIEFRPKDQWATRIGWLQTVYGTGQALGLAAVAG